MIHILQTLLILAFPALTIVGALRDAVSYTIPNWISLALIAVFPIAALAVGLPMPVIAMHLAVGVGALVLGMALFAAHWIGGGDAKLFAAGALWVGWPAAIIYLGATTIAGGALAFALLALRSPMIRPFVPTGPRWFARLAEPGENVPYGVAIAVGALVAFPSADITQRLGLL